MDDKFCPMMFNCRADKKYFMYPYCLQNICAWWNETLGECGLVVDAYLKGIEVARKEITE